MARTTSSSSGWQFHNYESTKTRCPRTKGGQTGISSATNVGNLSGIVMLLPYLDSAPLWNTIAAALGQGGPAWESHVPPSIGCSAGVALPSALIQAPWPLLLVGPAGVITSAWGLEYDVQRAKFFFAIRSPFSPVLGATRAFPRRDRWSKQHYFHGRTISAC